MECAGMDEKKWKADEIRRRVSLIFDRVTNDSATQAGLQNPLWLEPPEKTSPEVEEFCEAVGDMLLNLLHPKEQKFALIDDEFRGLLRKFLLHRVFFTYPSWHLKENMTDDEVLAAAEKVKDVLTWDESRFLEAADRLTAFRCPKRQLDAESLLTIDYRNFKITLHNLSCYLYSCSVLARENDSFAAGRSFLKLRSLVARREESSFPSFSEEEAEDFIDRFEEAHEELKIAMDYHSLPAWSTFRARAMKLVEDAKAQEAQALTAKAKKEKKEKGRK